MSCIYKLNTNAFKNIASGKIKVEELVTHNFTFDNILEAYETFQNASKEKALKVIIDFK